MINYYDKYIKYKTKYLKLQDLIEKKQKGGSGKETPYILNTNESMDTDNIPQNFNTNYNYNTPQNSNSNSNYYSNSFQNQFNDTVSKTLDFGLDDQASNYTMDDNVFTSNYQNTYIQPQAQAQAQGYTQAQAQGYAQTQAQGFEFQDNQMDTRGTQQELELYSVDSNYITPTKAAKPESTEINGQNEENNALYIYFIKGNIFVPNDVSEKQITPVPFSLEDYENPTQSSTQTKTQIQTPITKISSNSNSNSNSNSIATSREKRNSISTSETKYKDFNLNLSPTITRYVQMVQPENLEHYMYVLEQDQKVIYNLAIQDSIIDEDYVLYENYGKCIECWIADNMVCPCCLQPKLRRYSSNIFPVIDLICVNKEHTIDMGVKFFQVKASSISKQFFYKDYKYFSLEEQYIHVGSKNLGHIVHNINVRQSVLEKQILVGYICVYYKNNGPMAKTITLQPTDSFVVLPKINFTNSIDDTIENNYYYWYINDESYKHPIIQFSTTLNDVQNLTKFINKVVVPKNYPSRKIWTEEVNPYLF